MRSPLPTLSIVAVILSSCAEIPTENAAIAGVEPVAAVDAVAAAPRKPQQPSLFEVIKAGLAENAKKAEAKQLARQQKATQEPTKPEVAATENIPPVTVAAAEQKPSLFQSIKNRLAENARKAEAKQLARKQKATQEPTKPEVVATENVAPATAAAAEQKPSLFQSIKNRLAENAAKAKAKQDQRRLSKSEANSEVLAATSAAQTAPAKPIKKASNTASKPRTTTNSQDLAEQLREPDMLNRIDTEEPNQNASSPSKPPGGNPVIIKGDAGTKLPTVPQTTPAPPIGKP